jgi:hypothetical protein
METKGEIKQNNQGQESKMGSIKKVEEEGEKEEGGRESKTE